MEIEGVDYAFSRPPISALIVTGKQFACRYGGPGSSGKHLDAAELAALTSAGIAVVANAEGAAQGFSGAAAGRSWAQQAQAHFDALGMPADRPIYFSVDWNANASDYPGIDAALKAAGQVIGAARVGVYGSFRTISHCVSAGTARWFWQTYAWSGGAWHPSCHLQQYRNGVTIGGGDCDLNRAMQPDYGQWGASDMATVDLTPEAVAAVAAAVTKSLTAEAKFTDAAGGDHSPISDAVLNAAQIPGPGGKRMNVWAVLAATLDDPTADEVAQAVLDKIGSGAVADIAAALKAVLGPKAAAVGALLSEA